MSFNPNDDSPKQARRHVVLQCSFTASAANMPSGVSAKDAACNCARREQPWIAAIGHQPQQQQVRTAGYN
jgi:hypothetical protein